MATLNVFGGMNSRGFQLAVFVPLIYSMLASTDRILNLWTTVDMQMDARAARSDSNQNANFDFIIVGAGSAGSLVANRLSRHYDVLLLEAGGEPNPMQFVPATSAFLMNRPAVDWMYRTVPQRGASLNSVNQQTSISGGKGLGGSGNLNAMIHLRGSQRDLDNWANVTRDESWSYEAVLPYFKSYENYSEASADPKYRSFSGEINIEVPEAQGLANDFIAAANEIGLPTIDPNTPHDLGVFKVQQASSKGIRDAPFMSLLRPIRNRKSLTILKFSTVNKIILNEDDKSVQGVEYDRHGKTQRAFAKKEVIVSAGAIATPKLLMLSGIGPKKHLESLGIKCRHDLRVGQNLQDHLAVLLGPIFISQPKTLLIARDFTPGAVVNWLTTGGGILGSTGAQGGAELSSSFAKKRGETGWADIQLMLSGFSTFDGFSEMFSKLLNKNADELKEFYRDDNGKESFHIFVTGTRPVARGEIRLASPNPKDQPLIDPNYLNDPDEQDLNVMVDGVERALYLFENTTAGRSLGARLTDKLLPGCQHLEFRTREYWKCYVRRYTFSLNHPCGTVPMGYPGSSKAVLDTQLRVMGLSNLRVIDASVIPVIQSTNIQAGVFMIAEKGARMVLDRWKSL